MKSGPIEAGEESRVVRRMEGLSRGISIADLVLRIISFFGTAGSAVAMGTTDQTLPFSTSNFQFRAKFNDLPMFTFFVIANAVACGYLLVISLPLSIFHIIRGKARASRLILIFLDTVMLALLTAGASAATAVVYLAHKGNANANWSAVCQQFDSFCERISWSLVGSFGVIIIMIVLIILSAIAVSRPVFT